MTALAVLRASFPWEHASEAAATIYTVYACTHTDMCNCTAKDEHTKMYSPMDWQSTQQYGCISRMQSCTKCLYPIKLQSHKFLFFFHIALSPDSLCLPGRPIRFMRSKYWIRAQVAVLFPHQYGIAGHSSQCSSNSKSSSYETITWWPCCHMVRSVGTT